jgi:hypothetical protein
MQNPYSDEAKKRWGNTTAYKQSVERTKNWSQKDYEMVKQEYDDIHTALAQYMNMNKPFSDPQVQQVIARHFAHIQKFYDCSYEMYKALGHMYVDDKRFMTTFDAIRPGLAHYLHQAIDFFCEVMLSSSSKAS